MLGVAFSGGGIRSAAQLGIMQALHDAGIKPEVFTGTSGGAIIATLLALGIPPRVALYKFKQSTDILDVAYWHIIKNALTRKPIQGLYKGEKLRNKLRESFEGNLFSDLDNPLGVVTTDLHTGTQVIYTNSLDMDYGQINDDNYVVIPARIMSLSDVVSASCRLPAIFLPHEDGRLLLADGGLTNNLPSDIAKALGATRVISIDMGYAGQKKEIGGLYSILSTSLDIMMERGVDGNKDSLDIYLNPEVYDVSILDFHRIEECFDRGYKYGNDNIERIKEELASVHQ
jgi:NTE family protein